MKANSWQSKSKMDLTFIGGIGLFFLFVFVSVNISFSQINSSKGLPTITTYSPRDYKGHNQIWSIIQDERGLMYFGTSAGIIEYNGVSWNKLKFPNSSISVSNRAFLKDEDGRVYYGALGDFGYFDQDIRGNTVLVSLVSFLPKEEQIFNDVWTIQKVNGKFYFQTRDVIFIFDFKNGYDQPIIDIWKPDTAFMYTFYHNGVYYVHQQELGLFRMVNGKLELIPGSEFLGAERLQVLLPYGNQEEFIVGMFASGFFHYDGKNFKRFDSNAYEPGESNRLYKSIPLGENKYILAYAGKGIYIIDKKGKVTNVFNVSNGIPDDSIYSIYLDKSGQLWTGTENGLAKIDISSPLSRFVYSKTANTNILSLNSMNGDLYIGTALEVLKLDKGTGIVNNVPGVPFSQIFQMTLDRDELLIATDGLVAIKEDKVITIKESVGGNFQLLDVAISSKYPDLMYCSGSQGVSVFNRKIIPGSGKYGDWEYLGDLNGISMDVYNLVEDEDGILWAGTQAGVVYKIHLARTASNEIDLKNSTAELIGTDQGLVGSPGNVTKVRNKAYFPTVTGFFTYNKATSQFERDTILSFSTQKVDISVENTNLFEDNLGRVLILYGNEKKLALPTSEGSYEIKDYPLNLFTGEVITAFFSEPNGVIWLGTEEGLIRIDGENTIDQKKQTPIYFTQIIAGNDTLSHKKQINENEVPELAYANNSLRIAFASPFFEHEDLTEYQTFLEGFDKDWSQWSKSAFKEYNYLPAGHYTFRVKSKNIYNEESEEITYAFRILPPWYFSTWAYFLYIVTAAFLVFLVDRYQRSRILAKERNIARERELSHAKEIELAYNELKATQQQLVQQEKLASLGQLTAGIAHEIKNPLNFVNNFSELSLEYLDEINEQLEKLEDKEITDEVKTLMEDVKYNLQKILQHGSRADGIVKSMLMHSRGGKGIMEPTDLNELVKEYVNLAFHGMRANKNPINVSIQLDLDDKIEKVNLNPEDFSRIILNLCKNAFDAMRDKVEEEKIKSEELNQTNGNLVGKENRSYLPKLKIKTEDLGTEVVMVIEDNGPGIAEENKDKLLMPFFTTKKGTEGTGLGLSITYDIVKNHNGTLEIDSVLSEFTRFKITIPKNN
ncbi:two-component regulator propeller domain-containing protein [Shivajiella indica]|uniref:histidine kinase n=1 Tax=Shivajiella indica TaxID=872115 RepID=A0ABW5B698_9BACT